MVNRAGTLYVTPFHVGRVYSLHLWPDGSKGSHTGAGLLTGPVTLWGIYTGALKDCTPLKDCTLVAAVHEELQPMGRIQTEAINGRLFLWEGLWAEAWESPPPEWEVAETMCDDPIVNPIPIPGHHWGEVGRESEINLRWEAERSGRKVLLRFGFTSHYLTLIWLATNSRNFPKCFALENTFECLFLSLSHPMRVSLYWLSPVQLMRTVERLYHASGTQPTSQHRQKCYLSNLKNSTHCGSFQYTNFHIQPPSAVFRFIARSLNF